MTMTTTTDILNAARSAYRTLAKARASWEASDTVGPYTEAYDAACAMHRVEGDLDRAIRATGDAAERSQLLKALRCCRELCAPVDSMIERELLMGEC
jgi:hypothetical protein